MGRKTFNVVEIITAINDVLKWAGSTPEYRLGQISIAENILHATGNYRGFRYLLESEVPTGQLPGMIMIGTVEDTPIELRFQEGRVDQSRIQFFI